MLPILHLFSSWTGGSAQIRVWYSHFLSISLPHLTPALQAMTPGTRVKNQCLAISVGGEKNINLLQSLACGLLLPSLKPSWHIHRSVHCKLLTSCPSKGSRQESTPFVFSFFGFFNPATIIILKNSIGMAGTRSVRAAGWTETQEPHLCHANRITHTT